MSTAYLNTPFRILADYEQRSFSHVAGIPEQLDAPGLWRGIGFRLENHHLVAAFSEVMEIISLPTMTPVPGAHPWLLGIANLRSTLMPVVDLKQFFNGERTVQKGSTRALVIRQSGGNVTVLIDELYGQRNFNEFQAIAAQGFEDGRMGEFVQRAYVLDGVTWGVLDMAKLTKAEEFRQATS